VTVSAVVITALLGMVAAAGIVAPVLSRRPLPALGAPQADDGPSLRRSTAPVVVILLVVLAAAVPLAVGALRHRTPEVPITGQLPEGGGLEFLEERVHDHPGDPAARLDLADAYLAEGRLGDAVDQYVALVAIDPRNADAHARLGAILYRTGRPGEALRAVDRALEIDPSYPEAWYERGVILLRGLNRPGTAAEAFRRYLEVAPFGAYREQARRLLDQAERSERLAAKGLG
jgi:cytochrome c-type biogenesis protein CcmH/NrfG